MIAKIIGHLPGRRDSLYILNLVAYYMYPETSLIILHTGKRIRRFAGIYAYFRYFIYRKW